MEAGENYKPTNKSNSAHFFVNHICRICQEVKKKIKLKKINGIMHQGQVVINNSQYLWLGRRTPELKSPLKNSFMYHLAWYIVITSSKITNCGDYAVTLINNHASNLSAAVWTKKKVV